MQSLQETSLGENTSHVRGDGSDDDRRDLILVEQKYSFDRAEIVIGYVQRQGGQRGGNSWTFGNSKRCQAGTRLRQETVRVSVIAALEFNDEIALRHSSRQTHCAHRCFR